MSIGWYGFHTGDGTHCVVARIVKGWCCSCTPTPESPANLPDGFDDEHLAGAGKQKCQVRRKSTQRKALLFLFRCWISCLTAIARLVFFFFFFRQVVLRAADSACKRRWIWSFPSQAMTRMPYRSVIWSTLISVLARRLMVAVELWSSRPVATTSSLGKYPPGASDGAAGCRTRWILICWIFPASLVTAAFATLICLGVKPDFECRKSPTLRRATYLWLLLHPSVDVLGLRTGVVRGRGGRRQQQRERRPGAELREP